MQHSFALEVFKASSHPQLRLLSRLLWPCHADREDGLSEMLIKAINASHRFDGKNLIGWLKVILHNIKRDQSAKGFAKADKASRADGPCVVYVDPHEGYEGGLADLCDPEAILMAKERAPGAARAQEYLSAPEFDPRRVRSTPSEIAAVIEAGWVLDQSINRWWNSTNDDGSRYKNTERCFRYIIEDHPGIIT